MFLVTKREKNMLKMDDLAGKTISVGDPSVGLTTASIQVLKGMGLWDKLESRWISLGNLADALNGDRIDAALGWTVGDFAAGTAVKKMDLYMNCRVLDMNEQQKQVIRKTPGLAFRYTLAKAAFTKDVGMERMPGWALWFGFHWASNKDPELTYQVVKAIFEGRKDLLKISKAFRIFAENPNEVITSAISASPDVPVHPGAARFYKEIGIWKQEWIVGTK
jgi:TRAP transporter TAXI family solute receptor